MSIDCTGDTPGGSNVTNQGDVARRAGAQWPGNDSTGNPAARMTPTNTDRLLAQEFDRQRPHLRAVAYRMLGSFTEADDALQDAWLRAATAGADGIENVGGWLSTIVARICLNMLRSRRQRGEHAVDVRIPDPIVEPDSGTDPEHEAVRADEIGLALMVVLDTLSPAERLAFVLHDLFSVPFDQIGSLLGRSTPATRQLASRARRQVKAQAASPTPDRDVGRQRRAVDAFFAAAREGDFDALVTVLHPDVVLRSDGGAARPGLSVTVHGAESVARQAITFGRLSPFARPVLVNDTAGVLVAPRGKPAAVMAFVVADGTIVAIDTLTDPDRLRGLDLSDLAGPA
jgi:RNA polymerase sigma-70 factor (ECF subfamily)